mmetsp:Transcript_15608/g.31113  ORF Transcript_15608/g.31113 Transcript_15608/m.31113 type:complete len:124 (+) Transcript_15608:565-936(+)
MFGGILDTLCKFFYHAKQCHQTCCDEITLEPTKMTFKPSGMTSEPTMTFSLTSAPTSSLLPTDMSTVVYPSLSPAPRLTVIHFTPWDTPYYILPNIRRAPHRFKSKLLLWIIPAAGRSRLTSI